MNIQDTIKSISLDAYLLEGMIGHYCNHVEQADPAGATVLRAKFGDDDRIHQQALHAAADAVIFSQLAVSLLDDEEFRDALECRRPLDDLSLTAMRTVLFAEGLSVACETAEGNTEALARAERRKVIADQVLGATD